MDGSKSPSVGAGAAAQGAAAEKPVIKIGHYVLKETLGVGTFGKVKVGLHDATGFKVAIKILNRQKIKTLDVVGKIRREIQNLGLFRHPHIIRLYQVISTPTDIFMIMEHVGGGELFEYIVKHGRLKQAEARRFFQQIISGVDYCHRHMVVHRDLKPENLLIDSNSHVKIADFGLSNIMTDGDFLRTSCGSPNYAAPEVISGKLYAGPEVDVWSCGVILYALLCGTLPFDDEHVPSLFRKIKSGIFPIPDYLDKSVVNLLLHMLQVDPMKRSTIKEVIDHAWFRKDLSAYLFPPINEQEASIVDIDAVNEVAQKFGTSEEEVTSALLSGDPHHYLGIAYSLIVDNKRMITDESLVLPLRSQGGGSRKHLSVSIDESPPVSPGGGNRVAKLMTSSAGAAGLTSARSPRQQPPAGTIPIGCYSQLIEPGAKFCHPDCQLCPKWGATACLFGKLQPNLATCDSCHRYKGPGCVFSSSRVAADEFYLPQALQQGAVAKAAAPEGFIHPERMNPVVGLTPALMTTSTATPASGVPLQKPAFAKRAKWHLGIRSQSRPEDIMFEVFRAMKSLEFEWKVLNPYHVIVKKTTADLNDPRMSLQLYQVDQKSYLLDFKSLVDEERGGDTSGGVSNRHASVTLPSSARPSTTHGSRAASLPTPMDVDGGGLLSTKPPATPAEAALNGGKQCQTMAFFEMCADLIGALSR